MAVVKPNVTDKELHTLHSAGVRGLRCNIVDLASAKGELPIDELRQLAHMREGKAWVKLTGPYRMSQHSAPPYADLYDLMGDWVQDASLRENILMANPKKHYAFRDAYDAVASASG